LAAEQHDVAAAHIFNGDLPDHGNIFGPHPGLHAGTVNPQGNPATPLQSARNAQHIVGTAFSADPIGLCSLVFPILHQTSLLEIRRICLYVSNFQRDAKTHERQMQARLLQARPELDKSRRCRSRLKLFQLMVTGWPLCGEWSMGCKYLLVQSYSAQSKQFKEG